MGRCSFDPFTYAIKQGDISCINFLQMQVLRGRRVAGSMKFPSSSRSVHFSIHVVHAL